MNGYDMMCDLADYLGAFCALLPIVGSIVAISF